VDHDEDLVKLIEQRFKVDRATIMHSLTEGAYDDIAACYYVMYFERDTRTKIENEVKAMAAGGSGSLLVSSPGTAIAKEIAGDGQASSPSRTAVYSAAGKADKGADEDEEDEAPAEMAAPSKAKAVSPRKRRQTVGGDNEFAKLDAEETEKKTAGALKKMQVNDMTAKDPSPPPAAKVKPLVAAATGTAKTLPKQAAAKPVAAAAVVQEDSEDAENDKVAAIAGDGSGDNTPQGRKRHNTIVGIFRNTIRRPSEAGTPPNGQASPSTDKGLKDFPDSSTQEDPDQPDQPGEPRSLRFTFNSNSTSTKPPEEVINEVIIACKKHLVVHKVIGKYVVECNMAGAGAENVKFEIEVCKLPRLKNLHGLRFKRLAGSSIEYKDICEKILNTTQLV
jgi:MAP/microtubule affinity-regulating kinase